MPRKSLVAVSVFAVVVMLTAKDATAASTDKPALDVATWSGFYSDAQETAIFKPFTRATGIGVRIHRYDGDLQALEKTVDRAAVPWDVVDVERSALSKGCAAGIFEKLDVGLLLGRAAADDFIPGTLHPCGIGAMIWSQAVVYDATRYKARPPQTLADFFDLKGFPGARGLRDRAEGNLEIALMAGGIPPDDVYDILRKPDGVDQAFKMLDTIKSVAVFWRAGEAPERLLDDGQVVMSTAYAGRFQRPRQGARRPVGILWRHQVWWATYWAVPAGRGDLANAQRFVSFATDPARLAELAGHLWFGPARLSALAAVPANIRDDLPTARRQFHDALAADTDFWSEFGPGIEARFRDWRGRQR